MKSIRLVVVHDYGKVHIYKTTEICHISAKTKTNNKSIKSITIGKVHDYYVQFTSTKQHKQVIYLLKL